MIAGLNGETFDLIFDFGVKITTSSSSEERTSTLISADAVKLVAAGLEVLAAGERRGEEGALGTGATFELEAIEAGVAEMKGSGKGRGDIAGVVVAI